MTVMLAVPDGWRITCVEHGLDRTIGEHRHAANLFAQHERVDHAANAERPLMPAEAARFMLLILDDSTLDESHKVVARGSFEQLTQIYGDEAVEYARELVARPGVTLAHISPL